MEEASCRLYAYSSGEQSGLEIEVFESSAKRKALKDDTVLRKDEKRGKIIYNSCVMLG